MTNGRIKRPAYQWYVDEADGDEIFCLMTYEQQGLFRAMLDRQWKEGSLPADVNRLAGLFPKISRARFEAAWILISCKFQPCGEGRLINAKLKAQEEELNDWLLSQHERGAAGGRQKAANQAQKKAALLANARPNAKANASETLLAKPYQPSTSVSVSGSSTQKDPKEQDLSVAPKEPAPAKVFLQWFEGEYQRRRHGAKYFISWEKHMPIVGRLLKLHPAERLQKHAQLLLTTNEAWTDTTDRGIEVLAGKINWLEERLAQWEARQGRA